MSDLFVVDASVAVAWFVPQSQTNAALDFECHNPDLFAPYLIMLEVSNALLTKYVRTGKMPENFYREVIDSELPNTIICEDDFVSLLPGAMAIAAIYGGTIHDAYYISLAQKLNATLATSDGKQAKVARQTGVEVNLII